MSQSESSGVQAVIFDLSGTVLDYGSRGPVAASAEHFPGVMREVPGIGACYCLGRQIRITAGPLL